MQPPLSDQPLVPTSALPVPDGGVSVLDLDNLVPGKIWRRRYEIREVLPDITYGKSFLAKENGSGREVMVRSFRVTDDHRARAWSQFLEYKGGAVVAAIESVVDGDRRIEVTQAPIGKPLIDWLGGRKASAEDVHWIAAELTRVLTGVHDAGVAHLNLKPATVYVAENGPKRELVVGGLETLTNFRSSGLFSISTDPFYAPPEAAGLFQLHCGPALQAWDWWTLGRVLQEVILGTHVLAKLIDRDVSRRTPELLVRAEQFLREKDLPKSRPGGVELMGELDPKLAVMLRGLLSSCRDARWSQVDVQAWLKGETCRERYHLGKNERLYLWEGRAYAVSEAAEFFSRSANWPAAIDQIFDAKKPALVAFLNEDGSHRAISERIRELTTLPETPAFAKVSIAITREIVTAAALALISNGAVSFRPRGEAISTDFLKSLLDLNQHADGLDLLEGLCVSPATQLITQADASAGRLISDFGHLSAQVLSVASEHRWIARTDRTQLASLYALALEPEATLKAILEKGRNAFAASRDESLNKLFKKENLERHEEVVIAFTLSTPAKYGYVDHATWLEEQYHLLHGRGERIAIAATWKNLARAIRFGPHLFGPLPLVLVWWLCVGACVALSYPSRSTLGLALATLIVGVAARFIGCAVSRRAISQRLTKTDFRMLSARNCDEQGESLIKADAGISSGRLIATWKEINRTIAGMPGGKYLPVAAPESFRIAIGLASLGFIFTVAIAVTLGVQVFRHPPTLPTLETAWLHPVKKEIAPRSGKRTTKEIVDPATGKTVLVEEENPEAAKSDAEATPEKANESAPTQKALDLEEKKMSWAFRPASDPQKVRLIETNEPSPEQAQAAAESGKSEVEPYKVDTIKDLIAVKVPAENGIGLMLYDGRSGKVADKRVFVISFVPLARSWLQIDGKEAIYLGGN